MTFGEKRFKLSVPGTRLLAAIARLARANLPTQLCNTRPTDDVAIALRLGASDVAIELLQESLQYYMQESINSTTFHKAIHGLPQEMKDEDYLKFYHDIYTSVLTSPMDDDHVLFYAVYYDDNDMLSYLTYQARRLGYFAEYISSTNHRGQRSLIFAWGLPMMP